MINPNCDVEVGVHPGPFWVGRGGSLKACDRHRKQFEEREDEFGPFDWELQGSLT